MTFLVTALIEKRKAKTNLKLDYATVPKSWFEEKVWSKNRFKDSDLKWRITLAVNGTK